MYRGGAGDGAIISLADCAVTAVLFALFTVWLFVVLPKGNRAALLCAWAAAALCFGDAAYTVSDVDPGSRLDTAIMMHSEAASRTNHVGVALYLEFAPAWDNDDGMNTVKLLQVQDGRVRSSRTATDVSVSLSGGTLYMTRRCWLMGTYFGSCAYTDRGTPETSPAWYETGVLDLVKDMPREERIEEHWLLHTVRDLPCTIDRRAETIEAGTYVYFLRWKASDDLAEVMTEDGRIATLTFTPEYDRYLDGTTYVRAYLIDGVDAETYFDNLNMAG